MSSPHKIAPVCSIPDVGFNEEGIAKHIQDFCNEQRHYLKLKRSKVHVLPLLLLIFDYTALWNDWWGMLHLDHTFILSAVVFGKYLHFMFLVYFTIAFVLCHLVKFSLALWYIQGV